MSFNTDVGGQEQIAVRLTGNSVTDIVDASGEAWYVPWVVFGEHAGTTPNLTLELYDGSVTYYLSADGYCWNAKALTAKQAIALDDLVVPKGWKLRATSNNASGNVHATGTKVRRTSVGGTVR